MSLLLDALKKAAEQKAEKARAEEDPELSAADETGADPALTGAADSHPDEDKDILSSDNLPQDETDIDLSDLSNRLASVRTQSAPADETGTDVHDHANDALAALSQQMETGEDESIVFADEDITEFMGDPRFINRVADDETEPDLTDHISEAKPITDSPFPPPEGEETDLSQTGLDGSDDAGDEQQTSELAHREETGLNLVELLAQADDSELEIHPDSDDTDRAARLEDNRAPAAMRNEDTDLSHVEVPADAEIGLAELALEPIESGTDDSVVEEDPGVVLQDEDLSLLLRDDDTTGDQATSITEEPTDHPSLLRSDASYTLSHVDAGEEQPIVAEEKTATVSATATTGVALDTLTTEGVTTRAQPTSTRTYAPDNYDRTLMKLPGEDASKLFAGMKSDADVVMTPEYAKKVFQSKSSSQRVQHFRLYGGLMIIILLGIGVYSIFEIDNESSKIESNLQPLKRDPMPGVIRPEEDKEQKLLETAGVDEQTIKLVESASGGSNSGLSSGGDTLESDQSEANVGAATDGGSEPDALMETEAAEVFGTIADESPNAAPVPEEARDVGPANPLVARNQGRAPEANRAQDTNDTGGNSSLQLTTSSQLGEEHRLLRAAYEAYQAGNDQLALQQYNAVLGKYPGNRNALLARAAINVQNNNAAAAIEDYSALLLANPRDSLAMTSLITVANVSPVDAETRLKLMLQDEPDSPYLNFALANAYGAQDRWREAQSHYFAALENNPHDPNYAYNLAVSLEHIAKPQVAVSYYQRALDNMGNGLVMFSKELVAQRLEILGKL